ncbi:hypothetical protein PL9214500195 [Planktothrix tepida PCC 9214]|uniref:Uncharacterized protein n=1 Tax=Planktothrix tepida PCC 9214 TaxID=671072 RepID=A0A1J1LLY5_9CYAN|nr:hypothetical protein PL9214500195 [Planktothrix tepida PCC 9214]
MSILGLKPIYLIKGLAQVLKVLWERDFRIFFFLPLVTSMAEMVYLDHVGAIEPRKLHKLRVSKACGYNSH